MIIISIVWLTLFSYLWILEHKTGLFVQQGSGDSQTLGQQKHIFMVYFHKPNRGQNLFYYLIYSGN